MFELPEFVTLAKQINELLKGKTIRKGQLGNSPHKFVWYNRQPEEFERLVREKRVGEAWSRGKWLFIPLLPGYVLLLGECGGKMLYHPPGTKLPKKYHLYLHFENDSFFTLTTQMWGAMELYEAGMEQGREYVEGMRTTPIDPEFTFDYFCQLLTEVSAGKKRSAKGLLTQDQIIPGLGNAIAQDILFRARLHPRRSIRDLNSARRRELYAAILETVGLVIEKGGRDDEVDLYGRRGGYVRVMDRRAVGRPCPGCGGRVEKMNYLGGACYFCPTCQT
jgi:formamidopyrimidine-DNA glycosylase